MLRCNIKRHAYGAWGHSYNAGLARHSSSNARLGRPERGQRSNLSHRRMVAWVVT